MHFTVKPRRGFPIIKAFGVTLRRGEPVCLGDGGDPADRRLSGWRAGPGPASGTPGTTRTSARARKGNRRMSTPRSNCAASRRASASRRIIRDVNLTVAQGERHALIGPNGAGKSTLFNLISGYMLPSAGSILLRGEVIAGLPPYQINRRGLSRSFQVTNIFANMSVWENVRCAVLWSPATTTRSGRTSTVCRKCASAPQQILERDQPASTARDVPAGRADLCRAARARDRHHHRRRRRRHPARRADRRHEPRRDRARGRADPPRQPKAARC